MTPIKLLLIYDVPDWACHAECLALAKHVELNAPGKFAVTLAQGSKVSKGQLAAFDLVMSTIYYGLNHAEHPKSISMISSYSYWIRRGWSSQQNTETGIAGWPHLANWKYMVAHNKDIFDRLTKEDHPRISLLYHMLDHEMWTPSMEPRKSSAGELVIGFAGHRQSLKGLHLIEEALKGLPGLTIRAPTYETGRIPYAQMPDFYRSLDAYVCMSEPGQDAGPRPPIEAGLCGVPVITTRAGQIGEMVTHEVNGLVIERTVESIRQSICRLRDDVTLRARLSSVIRESFLHPWVIENGRAWTDFLTHVAGEPQ